MTQSTLKTPKKPPFQTPTVAVPTSRPAKTPTHAEITARARALWEAKGRPGGQDDAIWLEAEAQLKKG
jgi:hypothetical protein